MAVEPQVQQFIDFIRDEMPRRIKTNPNDLPNAEKLLVSVSGTLEVIYKTLAELDIAIKSDVDTELSNKEPSITAGSNTQYWRGDKTFQTLDAAAVAETEGRVYLSPEQKTVATQAASSSQSGYLTSADWSTFNGKQNALADVITSGTYGSSTQYPVITFNTKGIATGVTLQTVSVAEVSDNVFRIKDNDDATKKIAFEASPVGTGQVRTITMPNADVDLGKVPTSLTYDSATAALTQTLADSSSLSVDLSATAVSQIVLTGSATVVVSATQPSTKYFLAGSAVSTFDVGAFTNTGRFIEIVNNTGSYQTITLTATGKSFKDEVNDGVSMPITMVRGESVFVFPVSASVLQVYRNKPDIRNIKNNANTITSGFKTTNLFVDSSTTVGHISAQADEILRVFALSSATIDFGADVYDARTDTKISTGSYTLYAGQVLEVTKTSATKWVILGGHIQDTSRFRLYNSSNVPTKFDTSAATVERTITMPDADVNLGALKSLNTLPVGVTNLVQLRAGHDYFVTQSGVILGIQTTSALGLYDTSIGYSFSNTTSSDLTVTVRWTAGTGTPGLVQHVDAISGSTIAAELLTITPTYDYVYTIPKGGTLRLLPNAASNVAILRSFNVNVDVGFTFISDAGTTYIVPASSVTAAGKTIIELSNNSLTNITVATNTATGKNVGDSVNISITGTYNAQILAAGAGVVLEGDLVFYYQYQTKTLILKNTSTNTWKVVG